jgi:hypothetical protein
MRAGLNSGRGFHLVITSEARKVTTTLLRVGAPFMPASGLSGKPRINPAAPDGCVRGDLRQESSPPNWFVQISAICRRLLAVKTRFTLRLTAQLVLIVWAVIATSCTTAPKAEEVTAAQLKSYVYGPKGYYSTMFRGVRYAGSDANFDYIALTYGDSIERNEMFKVRAGELGLKSHMSLKRNPGEWLDASANFPFPQPTARQLLRTGHLHTYPASPNPGP